MPVLQSKLLTGGEKAKKEGCGTRRGGMMQIVRLGGLHA
jgi:hypothetical protein